MQIFPANMSQPYKRMVLVHPEGNVSHIAVEELLQNTQPLCCVYQAVVPLSKCCSVESCILRVQPRLLGLKHILHAPLV
jgi:hypothetical protein